MNTEKQSIYDYMAEHLREDHLPEDFELPAEEAKEGSLHWADGAMDGMYLYHTAHGTLPEGTETRIAAAVSAASSGDADQADRLFGELAGSFQAIALMEPLLSCIIDRQDEWNASEIYHYALHLMLESDKREEVKLGLVMMQLFNTDSDVLRDLVSSLGLSDEFTFFSCLSMQRWEHADEEIFDLAKKVRGWGRIHLVEYLEPVNEEIRHWLLTDGIKNTVMEEYSALTVYEKAGVEAMLSEGAVPMTAEEFSAVGRILTALLREGPVAGISALKDSARVLESFLKQADNRGLSVEDLEQVSQIYYYASSFTKEEDGEERKESPDPEKKAAMEELSAHAVRILRTPEAESVIRKGLSEGKGVELAIALGIPCRRELLTLMEQDLEANFSYCSYLMDNAAYAEAVLDLFRKRIPWDELEDDPRDDTGLGPSYHLYVMLQYLLQAMGGECRTAGDILLKTLSVPAVRCRFLTLQCLKAWAQAAGQPISVLSPRIHEKLVDVREREQREDLKKEMDALL